MGGLNLFICGSEVRSSRTSQEAQTFAGWTGERSTIDATETGVEAKLLGPGTFGISFFWADIGETRVLWKSRC